MQVFTLWTRERGQSWENKFQFLIEFQPKADLALQSRGQLTIAHWWTCRVSCVSIGLLHVVWQGTSHFTLLWASVSLSWTEAGGERCHKGNCYVRTRATGCWTRTNHKWTRVTNPALSFCLDSSISNMSPLRSSVVKVNISIPRAGQPDGIQRTSTRTEWSLSSGGSHLPLCFSELCSLPGFRARCFSYLS